MLPIITDDEGLFADHSFAGALGQCTDLLFDKWPFVQQAFEDASVFFAAVVDPVFVIEPGDSAFFGAGKTVDIGLAERIGFMSAGQV